MLVARRGWAEGCVELGESDPGREATTKSICSSLCPYPPSAFSIHPPRFSPPYPCPPSPFSIHPNHFTPALSTIQAHTSTFASPQSALPDHPLGVFPKKNIFSRSYPNAPPRHRTWPAQAFVPPSYSTHSETSSLGNQCPTSIGALDPHQQAPHHATSPSSHRTTQLKHQAGPSPRSHLFNGSSVTVKMQKSLLLAMNDLYT